jgi:putative PIN family toxin of toxin-antitoxin system
MLPLRLVLDTNEVVSAALKPQGLQRAALLLSITKPARLYVSLPILEEYSEVLARPALRIPKGVRLHVLQMIKNRSYVVQPTKKLDLCSDLDDNRFLECADEAKADYLITGNIRHFPPVWKNTKIVTARQFFEIIRPYLIR